MAQPAGRIAAAGGQGGPPQAQQQQPGLGDTVRGVIRMAVFWYFAMKFFGPKRSTEPAQLMDNLFQRGEPLFNPDVQDESEDEGPDEWVSYWKPNITINLVDDFTRYPRNNTPPHIADYINVEPTTGNYYPIVYFNEFWLLRDKLIPLNDTIIELPLNLELGPISLTKWQMFLQIEQSFQIHRSYGNKLEGEADELKRVLLEGNPYLLVVTMVVSVMHSIFDFLAFKNDIQFWNKNKSMEGLSAKSVVVNLLFSSTYLTMRLLG